MLYYGQFSLSVGYQKVPVRLEPIPVASLLGDSVILNEAMKRSPYEMCLQKHKLVTEFADEPSMDPNRTFIEPLLDAIGRCVEQKERVCTTATVLKLGYFLGESYAADHMERILDLYNRVLSLACCLYQ